MKARSNIQLTVPCLPLCFQILLPTNAKLYPPKLASGLIDQPVSGFHTGFGVGGGGGNRTEAE